MQKPPDNDRPSPIADINWSTPSSEEIKRAAHAYRDAGLSLIPILTDGSKRPDHNVLPRVWDEELERAKIQWRIYSERQPTIEEIDQWFNDPYQLRASGMAIIGGGVSGGVEIVDLDNEEVIGPWEELVEREARRSRSHADTGDHAETASDIV